MDVQLGSLTYKVQLQGATQTLKQIQAIQNSLAAGVGGGSFGNPFSGIPTGATKATTALNSVQTEIKQLIDSAQATRNAWQADLIDGTQAKAQLNSVQQEAIELRNTLSSIGELDVATDRRLTQSIASAQRSIGAIDGQPARGGLADQVSQSLNNANLAAKSFVGNLAADLALEAIFAVRQGVVQGFSEFEEFETALSEVFTLLPGISEEVKTDIQEQVQALSNEFGVLPDEVVPALYQALSAGVPQGTVFEFLETAVAGARGGVTDLETAVNGLTTVTNSFGLDAITTQQASDIIFETIRGGKTTFEELSSSLGQVAPTFSGVGLTFEELGASIATITSQGLSTSETATALKATVNSLIKPNKDAATAIDSVAQALIAQGVQIDLNSGSVAQQILDSQGLQGTLQLLSTELDGNVTDLARVLGSTEALNATLALTSTTGAAKFTEALNATSNAAGATETAYATVKESIQENTLLIQAQLANLRLDFVEGLRPAVFSTTTFLAETALPALSKAVTDSFSAINTGINFTKNTVVPAIQTAWTALGLDSKVIFDTLSSNTQSAFALIKAAFDLGVSGYNTIVDNWSQIEPVFTPIFNAFKTLVSTSFQSVKGVLDGFTALLEGDFKLAINTFSTTAGNSIGGVLTAFNSIVLGINNAIPGFKGLIGEISFSVENTFKSLKASINSIVEDIKIIFSGDIVLSSQAFGRLIGGAVSLAGDALLSLGGLASRGISSLINSFTDVNNIENVNLATTGISKTILDVLSKLPETVSNIASNFTIGFIEGFGGQEKIEQIKVAIASVSQAVVDGIAGLPAQFTQLGTDIMQGLISGLNAQLENVKNAIGNVGDAVAGRFKSILGIQSPSTVFIDFAKDIIQGIIIGLSDTTAITTAIQSVGELLKTETQLAIQNLNATGLTAQITSTGVTPITQEGLDSLVVDVQLQLNEQSEQELLDRLSFILQQQENNARLAQERAALFTQQSDSILVRNQPNASVVDGLERLIKQAEDDAILLLARRLEQERQLTEFKQRQLALVDEQNSDFDTVLLNSKLFQFQTSVNQAKLEEIELNKQLKAQEDEAILRLANRLTREAELLENINQQNSEFDSLLTRSRGVQFDTNISNRVQEQAGVALANSQADNLLLNSRGFQNNVTQNERDNDFFGLDIRDIESFATQGTNVLGDFTNTVNAVATGIQGLDTLTAGFASGNGNEILTGLAGIADGFSAIPGPVGAFASAASTALNAVNAALGDMGNGLREIELEVRNLARGFDFFNEDTISEALIPAQERISRGGILGFLGFTKANLNEVEKNLILDSLREVESIIRTGVNDLDLSNIIPDLNTLVGTELINREIAASQIATLSQQYQAALLAGNQALANDLNAQLENEIARVQPEIDALAETFSKPILDGSLSQALGNADNFKDFRKSYSDSIVESTQQALIQGLQQTAAFQLIEKNLTDAIAAAVADGTVSSSELATINDIQQRGIDFIQDSGIFDSFGRLDDAVREVDDSLRTLSGNVINGASDIDLADFSTARFSDRSTKTTILNIEYNPQTSDNASAEEFLNDLQNLANKQTGTKTQFFVNDVN